VKVQAKAVDNVITCSLPDLGVSFTYQNSSYTTGGVALMTFYANASFHYLKVTPP